MNFLPWLTPAGHDVLERLALRLQRLQRVGVERHDLEADTRRRMWRGGPAQRQAEQERGRYQERSRKQTQFHEFLLRPRCGGNDRPAGWSHQ